VKKLLHYHSKQNEREEKAEREVHDLGMPMVDMEI
jgi:hypothetical protein